MTESPEELAAVEQLLAESESVRGWLTRIDQAPGAVPEGVRQRVRDDYQRRLDDVTAGLRAHADVIAAKLHDDRSEHATLSSRANAAAEALAEAELRHAVGEYDGDRFENERRRHASDIETYQLSLGAVGERIARLEQIHALVERGPRPHDFAVDIESAAAIDDAPSVNGGPSPSPTMEIDDLAPDREQSLPIFDTAAPSPESEPSVAPDASHAGTGPLSFRPTGSTEPPRVAAPPPRARPFESAAPLGIPMADTPPRFLRPGERLPPAPPAATPATVAAPPPEKATSSAAPDLPAPTSSGVPVGRTLRCGECGAMNRPLEWYCEKCGAELTAV